MSTTSPAPLKWKLCSTRVSLLIVAVGLVLMLCLLVGAKVHSAGAQAKLEAGGIFIDPCSTPIKAGKASLVIGAMHGNTGVYTGSYELKIFPYFFMNETGSLSMALSEASVQKLTKGIAVSATGQATTRKNGRTRKVNATLTPTAKDAGSVTFSFTGEDTKLTFNTTYKFGGN